MERKIDSFPYIFMTGAPGWYKGLIVLFLAINPLVLYFCGSFIAGWVVLVEFLLVLVFSLNMYPLFPGGLLALEVLLLKLASVEAAMTEIHTNIDVIMLMIFLVPSVYFMKPLLGWVFLKIFSWTRSKMLLSLIFLFAGIVFSAWLDALTVVVVMLTACVAVETVGEKFFGEDAGDKREFQGVMRGLLMHGCVGTALGGVSTLVGEPQNLMIGHYAGWHFQDFYLSMARYSVPLQIAGVLICCGLEFFRVRALGFGYQIPARVGVYLQKHAADYSVQLWKTHRGRFGVMAFMLLVLILALGLQVAPIGFIGLGMLVLLPVLTAQTDEHEIGKAFMEPLPFTALLVVFFVIVAMIDTQKLFLPLAEAVLDTSPRGQHYSFFLASGLLSAVSDNVFVASVYIHQAADAMARGVIDKVQFDHLARMINLGTNIFSILTPNGQAAFLFLLTSAMSRRIGLNYFMMLKMAFPYALGLIILALILI